MLLFFQILINVISQIIARNRVFYRVFLLNVFIWIKVKLLVESFKCLNIIIEGFNSSLDILNKNFKSIPEPSVLIKKSLFVRSIRHLWFFLWNNGSFDGLFTMSFEKMFH